MGQDENTNPFNGNETPVFETPTPTPAPEAPVAPAPAPTPIPVTKPGQVSESVSQLSSYNRLGMRPSRNLSAREELDRIAPKAPVAPAPAAKEKGPRDPKIKIIIVLVIVTAIALVAMLVISVMSGNGGIFGGKKNSAVSTSGEANLDVIFDDKAYLPYYENGLWGYKNPENGEVVIKAKYTAAERFYGDYAAVSFVDGDTTKSAIIDKDGNVKLEQKNSESATEVRYEVKQNVWYLGNNVYDSSLKQLNEDGTIGEYVGAGYISNGRVDRKKGTTTVYLTDSSKNKIYDCAALCSIFVSENGKHAAINISGKPSKIISLPDGNEEYVSNNKSQGIALVDGNYYVEYLSDGSEAYLIADEKVEKTTSIPEQSEFIDYKTERCTDNGLYKVMNNDKEVFGCEITYIEPIHGFAGKRNQEKGKEYAIITTQKKTSLYNLSDKKEIKDLGSQVSYSVSEDGAFIITTTQDKKAVYSIVNDGMSIETGINDVIESHDYYITVNDGAKIKTYNGRLKEI